MPDQFQSYASGLESPFRKAFAITPHDSTELAMVTRGIYIGVGGDVVARAVDDTTNQTYKNLPSGWILPGHFKLVAATNTTATNLIGLY